MGTTTVGAEGAAAWLAGRRCSEGLGSLAGQTPGSQAPVSRVLLPRQCPSKGRESGASRSGVGGAEGTEAVWEGERGPVSGL